VLSIFTSRGRQDPRRNGHPKTGPSHMVIVLGSGGHSREMIGLLRRIDPSRYFHRTYIASSGDYHAQAKAREIESNIQRFQAQQGFDDIATEKSVDDVTPEGKLDPFYGFWELKIVPRARIIHQPIYTTPFSAFRCLAGCIGTLRSASKASKTAPSEYPDIIIANGPATAVMVIVASIVLKFLGLAPVWSMRCVYVESFARVVSLSLSGRIILNLGLSDIFIVQWEKLAQKLNTNGRKRVEYLGILAF